MVVTDSDSPRNSKELFEEHLIFKNNGSNDVFAPSCSVHFKSIDDQSVVTVPTVALAFDEGDDDCCGDHSESDCYESISVASSVGLNCVSFDMTTHVHEIPSRHDYTAEEIDATWYGRREKEVMREAAFGIAESLDYHYFHGSHPDQPTSTRFRGLESYTREGSDQRKLHRVKNLVAVLREQRRQRSCGELVTNGPEMLEAVCYPMSSKCQKLASIQGMRDERDARGSDESSSKDKSPNMLLQLTKLLRDMSQS